MEQKRRRRPIQAETQEPNESPVSLLAISATTPQTNQALSQSSQDNSSREKKKTEIKKTSTKTEVSKKTTVLKTLFVFLIIIFLVSLSGYLCYQNANLATQVNTLLSKQEELLLEIDELKFGKERLEVRITGSFQNESYEDVKEAIALYSEKYPDSEKNAEYSTMLDTIRSIEMERIIDNYDSGISDANQNKAYDTAISLINQFLYEYPTSEKASEYRQLLITINTEKEQARIEANKNNTGMWSISNYTDSFGRLTSKTFIGNTNFIYGKFSNSATHNSDLKVKILINNNKDIEIQLYEYAGNNPVKAYKRTGYDGYILDANGKNFQIIGHNDSDRIELDEQSSTFVHNALMKGGSVEFYIRDAKYRIDEYHFTIDNAEWYENAYKIFSEKKLIQ